MPRVGCPNIAAGPLRGTFSTLGGDTFLRSLVASARDYIFRSSRGHVHCQHLPEAIYSLHLHRLHCLWSPKPTQPNNKSHSLASRGSLRIFLWFSSVLASACLQLSFLITTMKFYLQYSILQTCKENLFVEYMYPATKCSHWKSDY